MSSGLTDNPLVGENAILALAISTRWRQDLVL
jgi:hypothetical protein